MISTGPDSVSVPDLTGLTESGARDALESAGFGMSVESEYSSDVDKGYVISWNPSGKQADGTTITVVVSKGANPDNDKVDVDALGLTGMIAENAQDAISNAELRYNPVPTASDTVEEGRVIKYSPSDKLQERALALEARNHDLADRQDYEVELATLAERARIAREIHDNVGHQLTRASLQTEALRVVHANEPGVAADFADVKYTVDEALQLVRASVHALNDNAANLSVQLERIVEGARSDSGPQIELEVLAEHAPANVANCFAAVLREALSSAIRHAHAKTITVRCMEHPSFYQLIVTDDGADATPASSSNVAEGMGLVSMRERVEALGGTFTAGLRAGAPGWRVFATVPKQQGDDAR